MRVSSFHKSFSSFSPALIICLAVFSGVLRGDGGAAAAGDKPEIVLSEFADAFRKHCVRVYIHGKSREGRFPETGEFAADIRNERPTLIGGYWWDDRHVVIEDLSIPDDFIRAVEIGLPASDLRYPARVAGRFIKLQAILLEVLPGDDGALPRAFPLEFVDGDVDEASVLSYRWEDGEWRIKKDSGPGASSVTDAGVETAETGGRGVFVSGAGLALGLSFGDKVLTGKDSGYWSGEAVRSSPLLTSGESDAAARRLRASLGRAVLETRFQLRVKVDDDDEQNDAGPAEIRAAGLVTGPRHLFVPLPLFADGIARIEDIAVVGPDGGEMRAAFAGAFKDYMAVLIETEAELPAGDPPPGFSLLNPLAGAETAPLPESSRAPGPEMEYIQRWRIDYSGGSRLETADYDRWLGTFRGYRGEPMVLTNTNEEDGSLAFDTEGNLVALALTPRLPPSRDELSPRRTASRPSSHGFRPLDSLHRRLRAPDAFDASLVPVDEEQGRRLIDFGVEYQPLDANIARLFNAPEATKSGRIGLLVTHVYDGSIAGRLGIREHDILLRIVLEGVNEPFELKAGDGPGSSSFFAMDDMAGESFQQFLAFMPPPWPARDNALSALLTAAGAGRRATMEYMREGEAGAVAFVTAYTAADYANARKEKFDSLGLTVKPVTYEVRRYFRRADASGVIVSKAEEGGKGAVAGLHNYLLITSVNGEKVGDIDDFTDKVREFEEGGSAAIELTVEGFGKTRLVKIE